MIPYQTGNITPLLADRLCFCRSRTPLICRKAAFSGRSTHPDVCTRRRAAAACAITAGPAATGLQHTRIPPALLPGVLLCMIRLRRATCTVALVRQTVRYVLLHMLRQSSASLSHLVPLPPGTLQQQRTCHGDRRSTASWQQQRAKQTQHAACRRVLQHCLHADGMQTLAATARATRSSCSIAIARALSKCGFCAGQDCEGRCSQGGSSNSSGLASGHHSWLCLGASCGSSMCRCTQQQQRTPAADTGRLRHCWRELAQQPGAADGSLPPAGHGGCDGWRPQRKQ